MNRHSQGIQFHLKGTAIDLSTHLSLTIFKNGITCCNIAGAESESNPFFYHNFGQVSGSSSFSVSDP
ncbi:hypothetical protein CS542_07205 [Pedobacter sp. IW39]|nr:hypothetical protein CS542_07205 [Pedobacter sp. IW39]